mgnify:CR=1 FL=1
MTKETKRKSVVSVFLALLIVALFTFSLTAARYSEDKEAEGQFTGDIEYVVANQVEVGSVEEFFAAIQNGYTNIKVADDVKNPIIVTGTAPDVNSDLTIDLNGHELQRNDRGPMLNVTQGVRLTIIDSSKGGGGGFYNPVGSVLNIDGGTLTVAAGVFESGPRDGENDGNAINGTIVHGAGNLRQSEYATSVASNQWSTPAGATISRSVAMDCYVRGTVTEANPTGYYDSEAVNLPVIIPGILERDADDAPIHISGNMYFGTDSNPSEDWGSNDGDTTTNNPETVQIDEDTYFYYVMEGMGSEVIYTEGSADFYYTYYVRYNSDTGVYDYAGLSDTGASTLEVKIYGYNGVKSSAETANHEGIDGYSAVALTNGNLYARGGNYFSYFGVDETYCVTASGGYMAISGDATTFEAHGDGVCVDIAYDENNTDTSAEYLHVMEGSFYSRDGDTVAVSRGRMDVASGASFTKTAEAAVTENDTATAPENGAAIHITGGTLTVDGSGGNIPFNISGSGVAGIWSTGAGSVTVSDATFTFNGYNYTGGYVGSANRGNIPAGGDESRYYNTFGICAAGGTVTATDCKFYMYDRYARGIYTNTTSTGGGTTTTSGTVTLAGNTYISVLGSFSAGILAYGGTINVNGPLTCDVGIGGSDKNELSSTAISTEGGNIVFNVGMDADGVTIDTYGLGITSRQGSGDSSITLASGELNINSHYGTAIYMSGGTLSTAANTTVDIDSEIYYQGNQAKAWVTPPGSTGDPVGEIYNGVYIQGGNLTANGTFNVSHTGVQNHDDNNNSYGPASYPNDDSLTVRSFAVRVVGGAGTSVTIVSGTITNVNPGDNSGGGGGLFVSGVLNANNPTDPDLNTVVTLGDDETGVGPTISSNGTQTTIGTYSLGSNWNYHGNIRGGPAVQVEGGRLIVHDGNYQAQQGSGILVKNGNVTINDGTFIGRDQADSEVPGAAASYGFKMYGGDVTINNGIFGNPNERGGGAFITWAPYGNETTPEDDNQATAQINGGTFSVNGSTGFAVHRNAHVVFGTVDGANDIFVRAQSSGLTLEDTSVGASGGGTRGSTVIIYGGTFEAFITGDGNKNGIWYGENLSTLQIYGGRFHGTTGAIRVDFRISTGWWGREAYWSDILSSNAYAYSSDANWNIVTQLSGTSTVNSGGNYIIVQ